MCGSLFNTYQVVQCAKILWNILETRYMKEDATSKKFLVSQFNNYQIRKDCSIMEQLKKLFFEPSRLGQIISQIHIF